MFTTSEDQECELKHVHNALRTNGSTEWALVIPKQKTKTKPTLASKGNTRPPSIGLPYVQGLSERLSKTFRQHGVSVYHKPVNTLRSILVHPKDKTPKDKKRGVLHEITCDQATAHVYIGETKRPLWKRVKEHTNLTIPTGVGDHCNATGHSVSLDNTKVLTREPQWTKRKVKDEHKKKTWINEPWTGIPAAPDLPPSSASWAFPAKENITWPRLLVEKPERRESFQNSIQSELNSFDFNNRNV